MSELMKVVWKAPYIVIAGDESLRNRDEKFPVFVSLWDVNAHEPWCRLLRMCSMKDKTAKTQAELFYNVITNVLGYPRHQVLFVLSDNTASVSGESGGCVTLLQEMLRKDEAAAAGVSYTAPQGTARGRGQGQRGGGRGKGRGSERGRGRA